MTTLIEFYDKDALKNITAPITLKPDKVIFFYDKELKDMSYFKGLDTCFKKHMPNIILEKYPVDILSIDDIYTKTMEVIEQNETCVMELTGGSELMMIAGYKAGSEKKIQLVYTDLVRGVILDLNDNTKKMKAAKLSLSDFIDAKGACFIGNSHTEPPKERYKDILKMSMYLFEHLKEWKKTCTYFQILLANYGADELSIKCKTEIAQKDGKRYSPDKNLLTEFMRRGFIRSLNITKDHLSFTFCSKQARQYMINYGVWLELFVFIHAKEAGVFDDVKLGTMIDWNAYDGITIAGNEIDVIISDNSMPVFISCKLREADTAALNELVIAKKRLGGWFSKGIIVTFGKDKQNRTGTYKRSVELGIELMDKQDIMSSNFEERLIRTIKEHDLENMKWKRV